MFTLNAEATDDPSELISRAASAAPGANFQHVMHNCGRELARRWFEASQPLSGSVCVITQAEDADGFARGVTDQLKADGVDARLVVHWSSVRVLWEEGEEVAPILRTYVQPGADLSDHYLFCSASVGSGTVLKTQMTHWYSAWSRKQASVLSAEFSSEMRIRLERQFPAGLGNQAVVYALSTKDQIRPDRALEPLVNRYGLPVDKPYLGFPMAVMEQLHEAV